MATSSKRPILLTGGAGFTPIILDDFSNSKPAVLERLQRLNGFLTPFVGSTCACFLRSCFLSLPAPITAPQIQ